MCKFIENLFNNTANSVTIIALVTLIISIVTLIVLLYNWSLRRSRISFVAPDITDECAIYFRNVKGLHQSNYDSTQIALIYIRIYNKSELPITIGKFSIKAKGKEESFFRATTGIICDYSYKIPGKPDRNRAIDLINENLRPPLKLSSFDYREGYLVFPYITDYCDEKIPITITAYTSRKEFKWKTILVKKDAVSRR